MRRVMRELLPGVLHWTRLHPRIGKPVGSHYLVPERTLVDALEPDEGFVALDPPPEHALLTNRHHLRDALAARERFGCDVRAPEPGMHEFAPDQEVAPYRFGEELPGGILALEVGGLCPDDGALLVPREGGILCLADAVVREDDGPLAFVPDFLLGDDPERVKEDVRAACRRLLEHEFDHLLLAHGAPVVGGGRDALARFAGA